MPGDDRRSYTPFIHEEAIMSRLTMTPFLRNALVLDAVASALVGLPMAAVAHPLGAALGLPPPLLFWAGVLCLPYAALLAMMSRETTVSIAAIRTVVIGNALWVLGCLALAFAGWVLPTALGVAFLLAQAVFVGLFAELQWMGWRRASAQ
jgi:hypothetical protein